jgi:hypothetical protein
MRLPRLSPATDLGRGIAVKTLNIRCSFIVLLLIALVALEKAGNTAPPLEQHGKLVVLVRLGDIDNSPATNVYVEAYGFVRQYRSKKSFILRASQAGRYEGSLPTGVYDVFVSEEFRSLSAGGFGSQQTTPLLGQ